MLGNDSPGAGGNDGRSGRDSNPAGVSATGAAGVDQRGAVHIHAERVAGHAGGEAGDLGCGFALEAEGRDERAELGGGHLVFENGIHQGRGS